MNEGIVAKLIKEVLAAVGTFFKDADKGELLDGGGGFQPARQEKKSEERKPLNKHNELVHCGHRNLRITSDQLDAKHAVDEMRGIVRTRSSGKRRASVPRTGKPLSEAIIIVRNWRLDQLNTVLDSIEDPNDTASARQLLLDDIIRTLTKALDHLREVPKRFFTVLCGGQGLRAAGRFRGSCCA